VSTPEPVASRHTPRGEPANLGTETALLVNPGQDDPLDPSASIALVPREWLGVAAAMLLAWLLMAFTPMGQVLSQGVRDQQLRWAAQDAPPEGVLALDIDDASLAELKSVLGTWPYKRDVYALAVDVLRDMGARAVAIDLLLADSYEGDQALARAIARPGAPVVLAAAGMRQATAPVPGPAPALADTASASQRGLSLLTAGARWAAITEPTPSLWPSGQQRPAWVGVITMPLGADGLLREAPLVQEAPGVRLPSFPVAVLQATQSDEQMAEIQKSWSESPHGRVLLAFAAPGKNDVPALPFSKLMRSALSGQLDPQLAEAVQGKVVFIGTSALLSDNILTPAGQLRGTHALAQMVAALRDGRVLHPASAAVSALTVLIFALPWAWVGWRRATWPVQDLLFGAAAAALLLLLAYVAADRRMEMWPLAPALAALVVGAIGLTVIHQRATSRRTRELAYENAVAAAANHAKTEFLANVSHEIRTPMNAVLGVADLLAASPLQANQRRHVDVLRQSGSTLMALIDDLLDLAKIEAQRFDLDPAPYALRPALTALHAMHEPRAQAKNLSLLLDVADDVPAAIDGDARRLMQALTNLLGNAIKFTSQGEVRLEVQRANATTLLMKVSDTGIGISPSRISSIFEPFTQADGAINRQFGGTGLGLTITLHLVQLMGGRIDVASQPGQGSEFTIRLPIQEVPMSDVRERGTPAPADTTPVPGSPDFTGLSLLLAEDNEVNTYMFMAMLEGTGAQIETAANGQLAVELFRSRLFDIAFVDVQMPGMDGHSAVREMRRIEAQTERSRIPMLALTANAYADDERASRAAGCDAHLTKPIAREALLAAIGQFAPARRPAWPVDVAQAMKLDMQGSIQRLGGRADLYQRVCEHARQFLLPWSQTFKQAHTQRHTEQAQRLADDLLAVAENIGATELAARAKTLSLLIGSLERHDRDSVIDDALQAVNEVIGPTMLALETLPDSG
jgi:signal transduction histidine kinase/CheY-like chemotaxis protein